MGRLTIGLSELSFLSSFSWSKIVDALLSQLLLQCIRLIEELDRVQDG
jgi:hypothetical protein